MTPPFPAVYAIEIAQTQAELSEKAVIAPLRTALDIRVGRLEFAASTGTTDSSLLVIEVLLHVLPLKTSDWLASDRAVRSERKPSE
jgi:hypothetical protein